MPTITCFGEVLWDVFPTHQKIGGAPLNVALRAHSFNILTHIISRVGTDEKGRGILQYINEHRMDSSTIQIDETYKTGCVTVTLDSSGSASYEIDYPVAWDKIEMTDKVTETVKDSDAFIFGSLACRDEVTKNTLLRLLELSTFKVFDVNLRPPFYSMELLINLMSSANFIKCNEEELSEICEALNFRSESIIAQIKFISQYTQTKQICVTKGKDGAVMLYDHQFYNNEGYPVKVADTVGAGDSFLATLMSKLLQKVKPDQALDIACAVGALVASKKGANPVITHAEILEFIESSNNKNA